MRFIIFGAGNAGANLAKKLCELKHDIVLIDPNSEALENIESELDVMTIIAAGVSPDLLKKAEVKKANMVIGVTNRDEVNILACMFAKKAGVEYTVASISQESYIHSKDFPLKEMGIDLSLSYNKECTYDIFKVLKTPGILEASQLFTDRIIAIGMKVPDNCPMLNFCLKDFADDPLFKSIRFIGLLTDSSFTIPDGKTVFKKGDEVYFVIKSNKLEKFIDWFFPKRPHNYNKIIIVGGSSLGLTLASILEKSSFKTVLIENDEKKAEYCSEKLNETLVIRGDASKLGVLREIGVNSDTAFIATTEEDEYNIVSCIQAKELNVGFTIAQINKPEYVPIINKMRLLDKIVNPYLSIIGAILSFVRGKQVHDVSLFYKLPGELLEVEIEEKNKIVGIPINKLKLPKGTIVVALMRRNQSLIVTGDFILQENDHLLLYSIPENINKLQSLF